MTAITDNMLALVRLIQASTIVDLSQVLAEELPGTWPGHMAYRHKLWNWFAPHRCFDGQKIPSKSAYHTRFLIIDEHTATHFDAPTHFVPPPDSGLKLASPLGEITGAKVPLEQLRLEKRFLKVRLTVRTESAKAMLALSIRFSIRTLALLGESSKMACINSGIGS